MMKCRYCGSSRLVTTGGQCGNPFNRRLEKTACLDCGRTVWASEPEESLTLTDLPATRGTGVPDLLKMIRSGEMPKAFYSRLAEELKDETPKNSRMRFVLDAPHKGEVFLPGHTYALTVTEYADVCEGETLTAKSVCCADAMQVLEKGQLPFHKRTLAVLEEQLRGKFESLYVFKRFCEENGITYEEQPLWVDAHSFNEYTGEHRGEYAPFAADGKEREDITDEAENNGGNVGH